MAKIIALLLLISLPAQAAVDRDELMHFTAHAGASFALQTGFYGVNKKWLGMDPVPAEMLAAVFTLGVGLAYKSSENYPSNTGRAMLYNSLGVGTAIVTHVTFKF